VFQSSGLSYPNICFFSTFSESNYTTAQIIDETIKKADGKWPGAEQFIKIMAGIKVDAVRGSVSFDELRNPIQDIYIKKYDGTFPYFVR
jgi:branched-chain amino acid transport system substrate-binding protein